jgi:FkbM family methyltransferase
MNIGLASIYFAAYTNTEVIYSYEPFKQTYEQALYNIGLNKEISGGKIKPFNYGLSGCDKTIDMPFYFEASGSMSTTEGNDNLKNAKSWGVRRGGAASIETVHLKDASSVISDILKNHKQNKILLKIDCEGSEYDILDSLDKTGLLNNINYIILEWHFKGESYLLDILNKYNFISFSKYSSKEIGLIYAVKA